MSHWKKFTSNALKDINKDLLHLAMKDMNLSFNESIKQIKNSYGSESVSAAIVKDGKVVSLGFNFKIRNGKIDLELSGDFYTTGLNEASFIDMLSQNYQKHKTIRALQNQGYIIENNEVNSKGEIVIEAYQWAE